MENRQFAESKKVIPDSDRCQSGIEGLDEILNGGLPCFSMYSIQGEPGAGKTTFAIQFLLEGVRQGQRVLYITFSETKKELEKVALSHGWDLKKIDLIELSSIESQLDPDSRSTLFHSSEVELNEISDLILKKIEDIAPARIVFDSVSEMRLLADSPLRYRRQVLSLKQRLSEKDTTVLFLDDLSTSTGVDLQIHSIAHGVVNLSRLNNEFGGERRRLRVIKLRGVNFTGGYHDFEIKEGGITVYPRMISSKYEASPQEGTLQSGSEELDSLLGGGLDNGTANLVVGPAGTGKSTLALKFALSAIDKGEKVLFFTFDETTTNLRRRAKFLGFDIERALETGNLTFQKIDPAEMSPGAFAGRIRTCVEVEKVSVVVIDSLNGYIQAMPQEQFLILQLHELFAFLNNQGVVTILTLAQQGMVGTMTSPVDLTYLADTVILTRYFESRGAIKKAISVIKKRTGGHENTIREFAVGKGGLQVGKILKDFQGVLTGIPQFNGSIDSPGSSVDEC